MGGFQSMDAGKEGGAEGLIVVGRRRFLGVSFAEDFCIKKRLWISPLEEGFVQVG
jgi:hypothetical protein